MGVPEKQTITTEKETHNYKQLMCIKNLNYLDKKKRIATSAPQSTQIQKKKGEKNVSC